MKQVILMKNENIRRHSRRLRHRQTSADHRPIDVDVPARPSSLSINYEQTARNQNFRKPYEQLQSFIDDLSTSSGYQDPSGGSSKADQESAAGSALLRASWTKAAMSTCLWSLSTMKGCCRSWP